MLFRHQEEKRKSYRRLDLKQCTTAIFVQTASWIRIVNGTRGREHQNRHQQVVGTLFLWTDIGLTLKHKNPMLFVLFKCQNSSLNCYNTTKKFIEELMEQSIMTKLLMNARKKQSDNTSSTTARPDHVWPEVWTKIGEAKPLRIEKKQERKKENPKFDNARTQRGIYVANSDDIENSEILENTRGNWEDPWLSRCRVEDSQAS